MSHNPILESLPNRLSEEATQFLIDFGRRHQFRTGETVVREGASCNAVYIVLAGRARIVKKCCAGQQQHHSAR